MRPEAKTFRAKDGRELTFLFDFDGMVAAEDAADTPFAEAVKGALGGRLGHLRALIYGGLKGHHPELTLPEAGAMIEAEGVALGKALWAALESAMPKAKATGGDQNPRKAAKGGTGSRSSPPGSKRASPPRASTGKPRAATR